MSSRTLPTNHYLFLKTSRVGKLSQKPLFSSKYTLKMHGTIEPNVSFFRLLISYPNLIIRLNVINVNKKNLNSIRFDFSTIVKQKMSRAGHPDNSLLSFRHQGAGNQGQVSQLHSFFSQYEKLNQISGSNLVNCFSYIFDRLSKKIKEIKSILSHKIRNQKQTVSFTGRFLKPLKYRCFSIPKRK